jgi:hypothetical protein
MAQQLRDQLALVDGKATDVNQRAWWSSHAAEVHRVWVRDQLHDLRYVDDR